MNCRARALLQVADVACRSRRQLVPGGSGGPLRDPVGHAPRRKTTRGEARAVTAQPGIEFFARDATRDGGVAAAACFVIGIAVADLCRHPAVHACGNSGAVDARLAMRGEVALQAVSGKR